MGLFQGILWDRELDCSFVRSTLDSPFCGEKARFVSRTFRLFPFYEERLDSHTVDCLALRYLGFYLSQERERTMSASKQEA